MMVSSSGATTNGKPQSLVYSTLRILSTGLNLEFTNSSPTSLVRLRPLFLLPICFTLFMFSFAAYPCWLAWFLEENVF